MRRHLKDYFIPHEGNDFKPHSLQKAALLAMVFLTILSFTATNLHSVLWISSNWLVSTILPAVIVDLTNEERESGALGDLRRNSLLDAAATLKAQDMATNQYFAHYSPSGVSPWHWFGQVNYNFVHAGENLAIHFTDSDEVVQAWMESPTHRANIMNGNYTEIGIGTAEGTYEGYKTIYVVQMFGTPAAAAAVETEPAPVVPAPTPEVAGDELALALEEEEPSIETAVEAESVAITEDVIVEPAPEEPVIVSTPVETTPAPTTTDIEVVTENNTVVAYSDLISTSTGGVPASISSDDTPRPQVNRLLEAVTQPHLILQFLYLALAGFIIVSLVVAMVIEVRRQHPVQIAYSLALLLLMFGLYQVHIWLGAGATIL